MRTKDETHSAKFDKLLKGKKIDSCRYMTREEADYIILQSDDEGNDGGAALYEDIPSKENYNIIYTI